MEKKRIGKTLKIRWAILTGGEPETLAGRDLTLEISSGNRVRTTLSFVADGNVAEFVFEGSEQRYVGPYTVTMWENLGKEGQTVVDRCDAFCLVARSCEEAESGSAEYPGLEIESLDLGTSNFEAGVPGASAYELFKKHNPDSELTEEEYAEVPVRAAGAALAMVEQLEETETEVKQAEQLRKQAERGREASEQNRATAEQARVTAEQQRALAEQTRVTNESARQTNEAGRQAAETKREENTSEAIRNSEEATRKAEDEAARVRALADNPPKIVEVEGAKYWAFWDEALGQYVVSENRADVGDAVLFAPQTLTPQQQEQARANIGSAPKYYDKNGFVISPLGLKVIGLRYIGFKEVSGDTTCYILTVSRCLKFDFKTFEVFWDVAVPGATDSWHKSSVSMRIIGDEVYIAQANWNIVDTGFNLIRLNDTDGSPIEQKEIPVAMKYVYSNILTAGDILLTSSAVYALDTNLKKIVKCDIETLEITELSDESSDLSSNSTRNLPWWITNEYGERELVIVNFLPKVNKIHLTRDNGSTIEITVSGISNLSNSNVCIYRIDLVSNLLHIQNGSLIYEVKIIKEDDAHYTAEFISIANITLKNRDFCRNSLVNYNIKQSNFILRPDHPSLMMPFDLTGKKDSAYFVSNKTGIALIADHICAEDTNSLSNIDIWAGI